MKNKKVLFIAFAAGIIVLGIVAINLPPVQTRLHNLWVRIQFAVKPPEEAVFVPNTAIADGQPSKTPAPEQPPTEEPTAEISLTPTVTATPLPTSHMANEVPYVDQHGLWNYCGPSNLTMPLKYWGWEGEREVIGPVIKPFERDKNVSPYEMVNFVQENTDYNAFYLYGGTPELLKTLIANDFPVLIEKGVYFFETLTGRMGWMGHYNVVIGYDDTTQEFIAHDSYLEDGENDDGSFYKFPYDEYKTEWQPFNYLFIMVYPPEQEELLFSLLGDDYSTYMNSNEVAAEIAREEIETMEGNEKFFAMFNLGTSYVNLQDYNAAANAYDEAFTYYSSLPEEGRPWRMVWYQFGPYWAYYYTQRYQDVVNLATTTLEAAPDPYLEESWYWRAMAEVKLGQKDAAIKDLKTSLEYHEGFEPSEELLSDLGVFD